ncbi:MAG: CoA pyrophosphatase [Brumimicrobium sp.]|nr:CoA pyrophosphatase [Brumimicrobium sp.]
MNHPLSIELIKSKLTQDLPGEKAHNPVSPLGRKEASKIIQITHDYRESAVGMILYEKEKNIESVLMQRNPYKGVHSGEVCFPGGKMEVSDFNLQETVRREIYEEIGIASNSLYLLGQLTPVYIPVSKFRVQPFVFYHSGIPEFSPNQREVAEIFSFPIDELFKENIIKSTNIHIENRGALKDVPYFDLNNKIVWGATALILNEFKELIL